MPYKITDGSRNIEACIVGHIVFAGGQYFIDGRTCNYIRIGIFRVVATLVFSRWEITTRRGAEVYKIGTRSQVGEQVFTQWACKRRLQDRRTRTGSSVQGYPNVRNSRFAAILNTISIQVMPYKIADSSRFVETGVIGQVRLRRCQYFIYSHLSARRSIAVRCIVAALILCSQYITAGRRAEGYFIRARCQVGKQVFTVCTGCGSERYRGAAVGCTGQGNQNARDTRLIAILNAVRIQVFPNVVTDFSRRQVAAGIIREVGVAIIVRIQFRAVVQALAWAAARTVARYCAGGVNIVATVRGSRSQVQAHVETHCVRVCSACSNAGVGCQCCRTAGVHRTARLAAVGSAVNRYIVVEQWRVFQAISACCTTVVADCNGISHCVGAVSVGYCTYKIFGHVDIRQVATGIICEVCIAVSIGIQGRTVEQTLSGTTARAITRHCAGSINIVATVRRSRSQVQAHVEDYRVGV